MKTIFIALLSAITSLAFHQPLMARQIFPFTASTFISQPVKLISFDGSIQNEKILLNWTIAENQQAGMFELQRSSDGKNFTTAALVFGTDKENTDSYQFYEKAKSKTTSYRLKIIYKDQTFEFSKVISINAASKIDK